MPSEIVQIIRGKGEKEMGTEATANDRGDSVRFFPIFFVASIATMADYAGIILDETVAGNLFDDAAFAAINLLEPYTLFVTYASYLILAGAALIARAHSANDKSTVQGLFNHCVTCSLVVGALFFAVYTLFDAELVKSVADDSLAYSYAMDAFIGVRYTILFIPLYNFFYTFVLYMGGTKVAFAASAIDLTLHGVLAVMLGNQLGVMGVPLASAISEIVATLWLLGYIVYKSYWKAYRPFFRFSYLKSTVSLGIPESMVFLATGFLEVVVNALALRYYSIAGVVVAAVVINVFEIVGYISEGVTEYETVAMNRALGERNPETLRYVMKITFRALFIESILFSVLFVVAAPYIIGIFDIDDAATAENAANAVRIMALSTIPIIMARVTTIFDQYTEKIGRATILLLMAYGLVPAALVYLLGGISIECMTLAIAVGPAVLIAAVWIFGRPNKTNKVSLHRMTVIIGDDF